MRLVKPLMLVLGSSLLITTVWALPGMTDEGTRALYMAHHKGMGGGGYLMKILDQLDLSEEQRADIDALVMATRERHQAQRQAQHEQMRAMMEDPVFKERLAKELIKQREAQRYQHQLDRMKLHHDIYQLLTDDQRSQLEQIRQRWMEKHRGWMKKRWER